MNRRGVRLSKAGSLLFFLLLLLLGIIVDWHIDGVDYSFLPYPKYTRTSRVEIRNLIHRTPNEQRPPCLPLLVNPTQTRSPTTGSFLPSTLPPSLTHLSKSSSSSDKPSQTTSSIEGDQPLMQPWATVRASPLTSTAKVC